MTATFAVPPPVTEFDGTSLALADFEVPPISIPFMDPPPDVWSIWLPQAERMIVATSGAANKANLRYRHVDLFKSDVPPEAPVGCPTMLASSPNLAAGPRRSR